MMKPPRVRLVHWHRVWASVLLAICPSPAWASVGSAIEGKVTIVDQDGKAVSHHGGVVIFLDQLEHPAGFSAPTTHAVIRQHDKRFDPAILPIVMGTTVDFPNDDTIFHNIFSLSKNKPFDLGIYAQGTSRSVTFDQPGLVKIYCNIHPQMVAYILVLANPYFATTDQAGYFLLPNAPLGGATVRSWYAQTREPPEQKIVVTAQGIQDLNLQLVESLRLEIREETISLQQHKNKWGEDYPAKY